MSIVYAHISFPTPKLDQAVQYCLLFYWVHDLFLDKLVEITESSVLSTWSASRFRPMLQKENSFWFAPWGGRWFPEPWCRLTSLHSCTSFWRKSSRILPYWLVPFNLIVPWIPRSLDEGSHLKLWMEILFATLWPLCPVPLAMIPSPPWLPFLSFSNSSKNVPFIFTSKLEHCFLWEYSLML